MGVDIITDLTPRNLITGKTDPCRNTLKTSTTVVTPMDPDKEVHHNRTSGKVDVVEDSTTQKEVAVGVDDSGVEIECKASPK